MASCALEPLPASARRAAALPRHFLEWRAPWQYWQACSRYHSSESTWWEQVSTSVTQQPAACHGDGSIMLWDFFLSQDGVWWLNFTWSGNIIHLSTSFSVNPTHAARVTKEWLGSKHIHALNGQVKVNWKSVATLSNWCSNCCLNVNNAWHKKQSPDLHS